MKNSISSILLGICLISFLVACKKDKDLEEDTTTTTTVNSDDEIVDDGDDTNDEITGSLLYLKFRHVIDGEVVSLDSIRYENAALNVYSVEVLKYFVSNFKFFTKGKTIEVNKAFYVDIEDVTSMTLALDQPLTIDTFTGISFTFGLDSSMNETGTYTNEPEINMEWPEMMGGGYHFMKLEGKYNENDSTIEHYHMHTGASAGLPFHFTVNLNQDTIYSTGADINITVDMNINEWMTGPNNWNFDDYQAGIMGDTLAQRSLKENGNSVFSIGKIQ